MLGVKVIFFCTARRSPRSSAAPCFARRSPHWPLRPPRTRRCAAPRCGQGDVKVAVYELRITPDYLPGAQKRNKCSQHYTQHALPTHAHFINKHWLQAGLCARDLDSMLRTMRSGRAAASSPQPAQPEPGACQATAYTRSWESALLSGYPQPSRAARKLRLLRRPAPVTTLRCSSSTSGRPRCKRPVTKPRTALNDGPGAGYETLSGAPGGGARPQPESSGTTAIRC